MWGLLLNITVLQVPVAVGAVPGALQRGALQPEVVVIRNGDAGGVGHQHVLGLVQLLKVGSLVGNAGLLDDLPTAERVVVFHHLVVAHAGRTT